jgi:putative ABC transport system ATP-binding protein
MQVPKNEDSMVKTDALVKAYQIGEEKIEVLKDLTLSIPKAKFIAIRGPSGSGKTTLLNIIGGIDRPTSGKIFVDGHDLTLKDEDFLSDFRCNNVGFVFQAYNLVSTLTVAENVAFPMEWIRKPEQEIEKRVTELLEIVGLQYRANHFPSQLSGGEQQRVAFARALANDPQLILADEPTGNLDIKNAQKIIQVLQILKERGKTIIVSTHDMKIIELADQVLYLEDGRLASKNE